MIDFWRYYTWRNRPSHLSSYFPRKNGGFFMPKIAIKHKINPVIQSFPLVHIEIALSAWICISLWSFPLLSIKQKNCSLVRRQRLSNSPRGGQKLFDWKLFNLINSFLIFKATLPPFYWLLLGPENDHGPSPQPTAFSGQSYKHFTLIN